MDDWQLRNAFELCQGRAATCAATASSGKFIGGIELKGFAVIKLHAFHFVQLLNMIYMSKQFSKHQGTS